MTSFSRTFLFLVAITFLLQPAVVLAGSADLKNGPVKRGTRVEELKSTMGEPREVKASAGEGVRVEKWIYADGVVVVVQDGYVLDSFVEPKK